MSAYKEYRFSDLIEEVEERNISLEYGLDDIVGVIAITAVQAHNNVI